MDWKKKLSSRKLWAAVAGVVTGLAMAFGLDENIISTVAGAVTALASVVVYIMTEGKIDAAAVAKAIEAAQDAKKVIEESESEPTEEGTTEGTAPPANASATLAAVTAALKGSGVKL